MTYLTTTGPRVGPRAIGCAALLALVLCSALTSAASASIGPLTRYSVSSATDSSAVKTVTAYCPARTHVLATGARITNGGEVLLEDVAPTPTLTGATATAHEDADGWERQLVRDRHRHLRQRQRPAAGEQQPAQRRLVRPGGVGLLPGRQAVPVVRSRGQRPAGARHLDRDDGAASQPYRPYLEIDNRSGGPVTISGYAICADPVPGWQLVSTVSPTDSAPSGGKNEALLPLPWVDRSSV